MDEPKGVIVFETPPGTKVEEEVERVSNWVDTLNVYKVEVRRENVYLIKDLKHISQQLQL